MTEQEKQILLVDLCARLPYGVIVQYKHPCGEYTIDIEIKIDDMLHHRLNLLNFKPYLRPMSSMTEEEEIEYDATFETIYVNGHYDSVMTYKSFDWLNKKHFDFRGLIPIDLALEATKGMYKIPDSTI